MFSTNRSPIPPFDKKETQKDRKRRKRNRTNKQTNKQTNKTNAKIRMFSTNRNPTPPFHKKETQKEKRERERERETDREKLKRVLSSAVINVDSLSALRGQGTLHSTSLFFFFFFLFLEPLSLPGFKSQLTYHQCRFSLDTKAVERNLNKRRPMSSTYLAMKTSFKVEHQYNLREANSAARMQTLITFRGIMKRKSNWEKLRRESRYGKLRQDKLRKPVLYNREVGREGGRERGILET